MSPNSMAPKILERARHVARVPEIAMRPGGTLKSALGKGHPDLNHPIGLRKHQRLEQHGVNHAEDRGIRADPQRQRDHRHRHQTGHPAKGPQTVADVSEKRHPSSQRAVRFFQRTVGFFQRTVGFFQRTVGFFQRTVGFFQRTVGFFQLTVGFFQRTVGFFRLKAEATSSKGATRSKAEPSPTLASGWPAKIVWICGGTVTVRVRGRADPSHIRTVTPPLKLRRDRQRVTGRVGYGLLPAGRVRSLCLSGASSAGVPANHGGIGALPGG